MIRIFALLLSAWLAPVIVLGWGTTGHEVVADIAERHLTPKARAAVQELLVDETMASVSNWMDRVRAQAGYRHTNTWHWVTIPDGLTYAESEKKPEGDVVEATVRMAATLRSDTASVANKRLALRYLIHMVGDLHQPLHVGNGLDKGGNDFQVRWLTRGSNLHRVWDTGIITLMTSDREDLLARIPPATKRQLRAWQRGTPADWAHECMALRPSIYSVQPGETLGEDYAREQWSTVQEQLHKAGVRLAWLLNKALG
jgi:hypothetical protein